MSTLEVLQSFPMQQKALLIAISGVDPSDTSLISFKLDNYEPHLPPSVTFMLTISCLNKNICQTILHEGAASCIMSLSCWQALCSPTLVSSPAVLKAFDGHIFKPHGVLTTFPVEINGKTVPIDVEVIDAPLDYNLLLGRTWFYAMKAMASTVFRLLSYPHQGKIITVNQLDFCTPDLRPQANSSGPLISDSLSTTQSIRTGLFKDPCLIRVFPLPAPGLSTVAPIHMISLGGSDSPWRVHSPLASSLPVPQDPIPLPSSSPSEPPATSNHKIRRTKRKEGWYKMKKPTQKAPACGHHVGHHPPLASANHVGGKTPTSSHYDGKKLANGHLTGT